MPEAARVGDCHGCLALGPLPHVGGPIQRPCSPNVTTNARPQARTSDRCTCLLGNAPDFIVTGSATVTINGLSAAREGDRAMHARGPILTGSSNVLIGGPTVGSTLGNPKAGLEACRAAALGRDGERASQSFNNCGIESARQIINRTTDPPISERSLFDWSTTTASNDPQYPTLAEKDATDAASGGTWVDTQEEILDRQGVPAHQTGATISNLTQAIVEGQGVIINLDAADLWPTTYPSANVTSGAWHAVTATGVEFNERGEAVAIIINDTGTGQCSVRVPVDIMTNALEQSEGRNLVVTDDPVW